MEHSPVVDEARVAFVVVTLSFLFDLLVWTLLMSTWLRSSIAGVLSAYKIESRAATDAGILLLGAIFPTAFAAFEVGFYRSDAVRFRSDAMGGFKLSPRWRAAVNGTAGVVIAALLTLLIADDIRILPARFAAVALAVFAAGVVVRQYGSRVGLILLLRIGVIGAAAYFTSIPLHLQLCEHRVRTSYQDDAAEPIRKRAGDRLNILGELPVSLETLLSNAPVTGELGKVMLSCLAGCQQNLVGKIQEKKTELSVIKKAEKCLDDLKEADRLGKGIDSVACKLPSAWPTPRIASHGWDDGSSHKGELEALRRKIVDARERADMDRSELEEQLKTCRKQYKSVCLNDKVYTALVSERAALQNVQIRPLDCGTDNAMKHYCIEPPDLLELNTHLHKIQSGLDDTPSEVPAANGAAKESTVKGPSKSVALLAAFAELRFVAIFLALVLPIVVVLNKMTASNALASHIQRANGLRELLDIVLAPDLDAAERIGALQKYVWEVGLSDAELQWISVSAGSTSGELAAAARALLGSPLRHPRPESEMEI